MHSYFSIYIRSDPSKKGSNMFQQSVVRRAAPVQRFVSNTNCSYLEPILVSIPGMYSEYGVFTDVCLESLEAAKCWLKIWSHALLKTAESDHTALLCWFCCHCCFIKFCCITEALTIYCAGSLCFTWGTKWAQSLLIFFQYYIKHLTNFSHT